MLKCRLCHNRSLQAVMHLDRVPRDIQHLLSEGQLHKDRSRKLDVYQCDTCGLVQTAMDLDRDYYDDYFMTQTFSSQLKEYLDNLVETFLAGCHPWPSKVLDVGCGDGAFMEPFRRRGIEVHGIEPSKPGRAAAIKQGFVVYPGYIHADTELPGAPYDMFVSRQVLEHVDDIAGFLAGIRRNLSRDGKGIIEVPRLEKALEDNRFYDFFPDHVNYFTEATLRTTLEMHGFEVLAVTSTMYDEYNVAMVRVRQNLPFDKVVLNREQLTRQIESVLDKEKDHKTAIWGAGAKGLSIMGNLDTRYLTAVVDSDPAKIGRYTPVSHQLIQDPAILIQQQIGTVIISAVAFQKPILQKLKSMHYRGKVLTITQQGLEQTAL